MANHKSAKKRAIQSETKRKRNMMIKTKMKNAIKSVRAAKAENAENAMEILNKAKSVIAVSAKKGVINKKNMARKISRLAKLVNSMNA
ncbi:30S ribosomal protein S20 [Desulfatiferula olefinivorans]